MVDKINFNNPGILVVELTEEEIQPITDEANYMLKTNFQSYERFGNGLAGHLNNEYYLQDSLFHIQRIVKPLADFYKSQYYKSHEKTDYNLSKAWINFQKKYEFNPIHHHIGIFSFALWLKVPYKIEDENKVFPYINDSENVTANFCFHYTDILGNIERYAIPVDKKYENKLVFFPSSLRHIVYPFYTSDDYRISVSGNLI